MIVRTAGNDLHRVGMSAVAANEAHMPFAAHEHPVPCEHGFVRQRLSEGVVEAHHHLGNTALGGWYPPLFGIEAELLAKR